MYTVVRPLIKIFQNPRTGWGRGIFWNLKPTWCTHLNVLLVYWKSRSWSLWKKKNIYIYINPTSPKFRLFCHTCLMTLSQTNHIWWKYDFVCYVITTQTSRQVRVSLVKWKVVLSFILVTLNLIHELFGTDSFCSLE